MLAMSMCYANFSTSFTRSLTSLYFLKSRTRYQTTCIKFNISNGMMEDFLINKNSPE